ncbi:MAG: rhodanese-like domain-containing protein [Bradymonadaceae bacterium]|nr:rhodanese-like domain-containing protein [Lujinxingiaceae bacterium]
MIDVHKLEALLSMARPIRLLDVRTAGEYESMHIPGSYNVPLDSLGRYASELCDCVDDPVVLVCQSGQRAQKAHDALSALGMKNIHLLDGGVSHWARAGLPVNTGRERLSLERQVRIAAGALAATGALLALLAHPLFALLPAFVGSGLVVAGVTNTCAMAMILARLPYNRPVGCNVEAMVRSLKDGPLPENPFATTVQR